jgi:hypothetical protein
MPIQQRARYRILSGLLDTSFGKSSEKAYPNHFVKMTMPLENTIQIKAQIIVRLGGTNMYHEMRRKYREEMLEIIKQRLERIADEYKRAIDTKSNLLEPKVEKHEEPAPKTVKLSLDSSTIQEGIEHIGMSAYNTEKTCIFRLECLANIS